MTALLRARLVEVLKAVAPLLSVVTVLQIFLVHAPTALFLRFLAGSTLAILGMLFLFTGIEMGILPMGRYLGAELPRKGSIWLIVAVAFALGFATTLAEPDVLVLADQVQDISRGELGGQLLIYTIAVGVGLFAALALFRVIRGFSMAILLTVVYAVVILLSLLAPEAFIGLAHDAGAVTTGVLTAPVVLALTLGVTSVVARRSAVSDGFGLLGLASVGPIIGVLLLGLLLR